MDDKSGPRNGAGDDRHAHLGRVVKGASVNLAGSIVGKVVGYLYTIFLARILTTSEIGLYFLGLTFLQFLTAVAQLGLDVSILRYVSLFEARKDFRQMNGTVRLTLLISVPLGTVLALAQFLSSESLAAGVFGKPDLTSVLRGLSLAIPFILAGNLWLTATQALRQMQYQVYVRHLLEPGVRFALMFLLYWMGIQLQGAVVAYTVGAILAALLALAFQRRAFAYAGRESRIPDRWKEMLAYALRVIFARYLALFVFWSDTLMLGILGTESDVGIYNVALRTVMLGLVVNESLNLILSPTISAYHESGDQERLESTFKSVSKWNFTFAYLVFLAFLAFRRDILQVFGSEYLAGDLAFAVLAVSMLAHTAFGSIGRLTLMTGRSQINLYNNVGVASLNILLNWLLIPPYGILGAALATATSAILLGVVRFAECVLIYGFHPFRLSYLKPIASGLAAVAVALGVAGLLPGLHVLIRLAISGSVLAGLYVGGLFLLGIEQEDRYVLDRLRGKFRRGAG